MYCDGGGGLPERSDRYAEAMTVAIKENRRADAWEAVGGKESRVRAGLRYMYLYIYIYIYITGPG